MIGTLYGYLFGLAIDKARVSSFGLTVAVLFLIYIIDFIDSLVFERYGRIYVEKCANNIMEKIGCAVYEKVGLLPARAFEEKSSGEFINRITNDSSTIADSFRQILRIIISLFTCAIVFIYICFNSWIVALEIIIYLVLFYIVSHKYLPSIKEKQKEINKEKDRAVASVSESVRGIREIRALGIRKSMNDNFKNIVRNIYFKINKQMITERNYNAWIYILNCTLEFVIFTTCIILIISGHGSFAFFMAMTYYIYRFMNTIELMMNLSTSIQKMKVSIERLSEILDNKLYNDEKFGIVSKTDIDGNIEFKNITFKYPNEEKETLKDFSLSIPTNKKVAIVGKSGQGKTTIFNLLLKYFKPTNGTIYIDDIPLDDFTEESLRQNIAIIRQEPFLFNKTIVFLSTACSNISLSSSSITPLLSILKDCISFFPLNTISTHSELPVKLIESISFFFFVISLCILCACCIICCIFINFFPSFFYSTSILSISNISFNSDILISSLLSNLTSSL